MPERRRGGRLLATAAAATLATALLAPAAGAQIDELPTDPRDRRDDRWAASTFDAPFDEPGHTVRAQPFEVAGTLRYEKLGPADHIAEAEVRVVPDGGEDLADGCRLPDPVTVTGPGFQPEPTAELVFDVTGLEVPCNGRYLVEVEAVLDDPDARRFTLRQPFTVGALPPTVTDLAVELDESGRQVTVTFRAVPEGQLPPDALGYVVERAGPADGPSAGTFVDVGMLDLDDRPRFVDDLGEATGGAYTYRVRTVRAGADGPERSSVIDTDTETITIGEPAEHAGRSGAASGPRTTGRSGTTVRRSSTAPRRVTVTTLDTGFEETLDYGEEPERRTQPTSDDIGDGGDEPLAGQSIIQDEGDGEGVDLAAPVAGALVLLGWAGHILYLNRLAKQLSPVA